MHVNHAKTADGASSHGQGADCLQLRHIIAALLQIVIGNKWPNRSDEQRVYSLKAYMQKLYYSFLK